MNEKSRYRLTGAVFILSLAVIFLPMLFDADGLEPVRLEPIPEVEVKQISFAQFPKEKLNSARQLRKKIDPTGYSRLSGVRTGDPEFMIPGEVTPENAAGWGVQVGSFKKEENALALRDELQKQGYHAALSHVRQGNEISTRVAVGPVAEETEARKVQQELAAHYGKEPILVRFGY